ncbi:Integral membrane sensor hybrid histidine kinase (fragment) [Desulfamplus magnetovallimortis]|uniref:Integral membrane sensor hybrid histidine kinase n=1 Tax=Desulfamplus magnetovallimortis TaxID=1246637 RepID=A0A1W1HIX8_9BACT
MSAETVTAKKRNVINQVIFIIAAGLLLYMLRLHSFLLFHTFVELVGVGVALGIFFITWNARDNIDNHFFLFVGICHFFIAIISLLHTLAYKGMNIFHGFDANLPTQLWIMGGYLQCSSFAAAQFFFNKKVNPHALFYTGLLMIIVITAMAFEGWFPDCYIEGQGLTIFKKLSELVICLTLIASIIPIRRTKLLTDSLKTTLTAALIVNSLSRLAFILYVGVYDISNLLGHVCYLVYVYFIYRLIIEESMTKPQNILFSRLKRKKMSWKS